MASKAEIGIQSNLEKINALLDATAEKLERLGNSAESLEKLKKKTKETENSLATFAKKAAAIKVGFLIAEKAIKKFTDVTNETQATLNRVNSIMGDNIDTAKDYADKMQRLAGIRAADFLKFQSVIYQSSLGMGQSAKNAAVMSKNIAQLSYDMAAFYGEMGKVDNYLSALQNGLTGNAKQLRNLGFALTEADLRQEALLEGLDVNIRDLNTASKSLLRYNAIIRQSANMQGAYVKSFMTLSTAQSVLDMQAKELYNSIGTLLYPILMKIIPYMIGFVKLLDQIVRAIAGVFGVELPTIDVSPTTAALNDVEDAAESAGKAIEKSFTLGIDELNVLDDSAANAGNSLGGMDITGLASPLDYDFFANYEGSEAQKFFDSIQEKMGAISGLAAAIGAGIAAWSIASILSDIPAFIAHLKTATLYAGLIGGAMLLTSGAADALANGVDWQNFATMLAGIALSAFALWLNFGMTAASVALLIGGVVLLAVGIKDIIDNGANLWNVLATITGMLLVVGAISKILGKILGMKALSTIGAMILKIAVALVLVVAGVLLLVKGLKDLTVNGANEKNLAMIYTSIIIIAGALMLVNVNLGLVVGAVLLVIVTFMLFADKVVGAISWVIGAITNIIIACMNVGAYVGQLAVNIVKVIANLVITIWTATENVLIFFKNLGAGVGDLMRACATNVSNTFIAMWDRVKIKTLDFQETVLTVVRNIANKANDLLGIFGVQIDTSGIETQLQNLRDKKSQLEGDIAKLENVDLAEAFKKGFETFDYASFTERWLEVKGEDVDNAINTFKYLDLDEVYKRGAQLGTNAQEYWKGKISGIELPSLGEEGTNALIDTNKIQEEIADMTKDFSVDMSNVNDLIGEDVLTNQLQNNLALSDVETAIGIDTEETKKASETAETAMKSIGDKIDAVREACEDIEINVYNGLMAEGYAGGGYPASGRLFFANENGNPELVGRVGNRTVVANNDQIFQGIFQAVSAGMANMAQQPIEVTSVATLDGEVIYRNQQKVASRKGYSMGGGAFAHV